MTSVRSLGSPAQGGGAVVMRASSVDQPGGIAEITLTPALSLRERGRSSPSPSGRGPG